jgi:formylglycine-generating enzyme required for sulfatase activity
MRLTLLVVIALALLGCANLIRDGFYAGDSCGGSADSGDQMVKVGNVCVDRYESSVWSSLAGGEQLGLDGTYPCAPNGGDCRDRIYARSVKGVLPATSITWFQASVACANSGKRLLTNAEWQLAALGTIDRAEDCNIAGVANRATGLGACRSAFGVFDAVGNAAEWVADWSQANTRNDGGERSSADYGNDAIKGIDEGAPESSRFPAALLRGGSWQDKEAAGVYALDAQHSPVRSRAWIGFRCSK